MTPRTPAMTPRQFDAALKQLGISVYASAKVLCVSLRQAQRYSSGEAPVPPSIAKLIRALIALGRVDV
jgi:transcriptional regulator with XRE-family HTH domain